MTHSKLTRRPKKNEYGEYQIYKYRILKARGGWTVARGAEIPQIDGEHPTLADAVCSITNGVPSWHQKYFG